MLQQIRPVPKPLHTTSNHHLDPLILFGATGAALSQHGLQVGLRSFRHHSSGHCSGFRGGGGLSGGVHGIDGLATVHLVNSPVPLLTGVTAVAGVPAAVVECLLPAAGTLHNGNTYCITTVKKALMIREICIVPLPHSVGAQGT